MRIKNWRKFQMYKHRSPPWIKLHRDLLERREWVELDAGAAKLLISLWILAAETDGELPDAATIAWRLRMPEKEVARCLALLGDFVDGMEEQEEAPAPKPTPTPTSTKKRTTPAVLSVADLEARGVREEHAADWLRVRKEKRSPLTITAWEALCREAERASITPAQAVQMCAERGWQSYQARYGRPEASTALDTGDYGESGQL